MRPYLLALWSGKAPLWKAVWLGFAPVVLLLYALWLALVWLILPYPAHVVGWSSFLFGLFALACLVVTSFAVWRCARNSHQILRIAVRAGLVLWVLWYARKIAVLGWFRWETSV